jgi:hypothetical protein
MKVIIKSGLDQERYIILKLSSFFFQVLASKASVLLDFPKDLESLESASKVCSCSFLVLYSLVSIGSSFDRPVYCRYN